jgi:hypothetical protein
MVWVALVAAALGASVFFARAHHLRVRDRREQDLLGAQALYEEMDAALRSINMAARNVDSRWVAGLSESRTLAETWLEHGPAFQRLDLARWEILDDAVRAVEPSFGLGLVRATSDPLHPSLPERQERLRRGMDVLRDLLPAEATSVEV